MAVPQPQLLKKIRILIGTVILYHNCAEGIAHYGKVSVLMRIPASQSLRSSLSRNLFC